EAGADPGGADKHTSGCHRLQRGYRRLAESPMSASDCGLQVVSQRVSRQSFGSVDGGIPGALLVLRNPGSQLPHDVAVLGLNFQTVIVNRKTCAHAVVQQGAQLPLLLRTPSRLLDQLL